MRRWVGLVLVAGALTACGGGDGGGAVTVLAASSLTEVLEAIGEEFDGDVTFSFGGSSALVEQVAAGSPADVLVTADLATMATVEGVEETTIVARNRLTVIVEAGNPKHIESLADLARDDVLTVLCAPAVPCGKLGAAALERAGVTVEPASLEENVKGVASKVALGEADAGIVYATDVLAAGDGVEAVAFDSADDPELEAVYPMAVLPDASDVELARRFVDFVAAREGQAILREHGFLAP